MLFSNMFFCKTVSLLLADERQVKENALQTRTATHHGGSGAIDFGARCPPCKQKCHGEWDWSGGPRVFVGLLGPVGNCPRNVLVIHFVMNEKVATKRDLNDVKTLKFLYTYIIYTY